MSEDTQDYATRGAVVGENAGAVFAKLAKVMGEVHRIPKTGHNKFNNYHYATESDAADAIRPLLSEAGLGLMVSIDRVDEMDNGRVMVYGTVTIGEEGGGWIQASISGEARDVDRNGARQDKGVYKAITGAVKYWLFKTFLMSTGDDPEGDQNNPQDVPPPGPPPTPMMTDAQEQLIRSLAKSSKLTEEEQTATVAWLDGGSITRDKASQMIDRLTEKTK